MTAPGPARRERIFLACAIAVFLLLAGTAAWRDASVADEHPHILAGWLQWRTHQGAGGFDNPPLGQLLLAAPLAAAGPPYRFPDDAALLWCRVPVLLVTAGLGLVVWCWGRALGGGTVAALALGMFVLEPNFLAHGHVATLDAMATAAWWLALWRWRAVLAAPGRAVPRSALAAFAAAAAAAILVKLTALVLLPVAFAAAIAVRRDAAGVRRAAAGLGAAAVVTVLLAYLLYGRGPTEALLPQALVDALRGKAAHRDEVQFAYLAGQRSAQGFWAYYGAALLLKCPLPLWALAAWGLRRARAWPRVDQALIAIPAAAICAAFTVLHVNIGVRHVLPAVPALLLLAAAGGADLWRRGRAARAVLVTLCLFWAGDVARVVPQYFAYFNALAGGPAGGHRWLLDSNLAWGQDDRRLQAFLTAAQRRGEHWDVLPDPDLPRTGRFVVEVNALHNLQRRSDRPYEWLRDLAPVGFAGWSWRCYAPDVESYAAAAARDPRSTAAAVAYAEVARAAGDSARARAVLAAAAASDPGGAAERVARMALARGDWRTARAWLDHAARAPERSAEWADLAAWCGLQARVANAAGPEERGRAEAELGIWYGERGKRRAAVEMLTRAVAAPGAGAETWRALAIAHAQSGAYAAARDVLVRGGVQGVYAAEFALCAQLAAAGDALAAGRAVPAEVAFELGRGLFEAEQYDSAAAAFAGALRADSRHRLALAYLGEMQVRCKMRIVNQRLTPRAVTAAR